MNLPKPYISFSQYDLWKRSKKQYRQKYYENKDIFPTKYMKFGKQFAEDRERRIIGYSFKKEYVKALNMPQFNTQEKKIECSLGELNLLGYIDSAEVTKDGTIIDFLDDKTSTEEWSAVKVKAHKQFWLYCLIIQQLQESYPKQYAVNWYETSLSEGGEVEFTGKTKHVVVDSPSREELFSFKDELIETAKEIEEDYARWKNGELEINEEIEEKVKEYFDIKQEIDDLKEKQSFLNIEIDSYLTRAKIDNIDTLYGSVFYTKRKKYNYTDDQLALIDSEKNALKVMEKAFKDELIPDITKTLSFRTKKVDKAKGKD